MNSLELQCAAILKAATSATYGLVIGCSNAARARQALYRTRSMLGDRELSSIQIRVSPDDSEHELWLIRAQPAVDLTIT